MRPAGQFPDHPSPSPSFAVACIGVSDMGNLGAWPGNRMASHFFLLQWHVQCGTAESHNAVAACGGLHWISIQNYMHACQRVSCMVAMQGLMSHLTPPRVHVPLLVLQVLRVLDSALTEC